MSQPQTLLLASRPIVDRDARRRSRRREERAQQAVALCLLTLTVLVSVQLDHLALALTR